MNMNTFCNSLSRKEHKTLLEALKEAMKPLAPTWNTELENKKAKQWQLDSCELYEMERALDLRNAYYECIIMNLAPDTKVKGHNSGIKFRGDLKDYTIQYTIEGLDDKIKAYYDKTGDVKFSNNVEL